jgi:hypothetical protein
MTIEPVDPLPRFHDVPVTSSPPPLEFLNSILIPLCTHCETTYIIWQESNNEYGRKLQFVDMMELMLLLCTVWQ